MITIFKNKNDIPQNREYVELNDIFFNQKTVARLDERSENIIKKIDQVKLAGRYKIESKFNGVMVDIDCLSTGCKTVLNVLYFPDKVFCLKESGENALEVLYQLEQGGVYSDYAMIPFELENIKVRSGMDGKIITDYEELKRWWDNEE